MYMGGLRRNHSSLIKYYIQTRFLFSIYINTKFALGHISWCVSTIKFIRSILLNESLLRGRLEHVVQLEPGVAILLLRGAVSAPGGTLLARQRYEHGQTHAAHQHQQADDRRDDQGEIQATRPIALAQWLLKH